MAEKEHPYVIRDSRGAIKAFISERVALFLQTQVPGFLRNAKYESGIKVVFEITGDMIYKTDPEFSVPLWEGDIIAFRH